MRLAMLIMFVSLAILWLIGGLQVGCRHVKAPGPGVPVMRTMVEPNPDLYRLMRPGQGNGRGELIVDFGKQYRAPVPGQRVEHAERIIEPAPTLGKNKMGQHDPNAKGLEDTL